MTGKIIEKIISVKEGKVVEKDGKDWVELIDHEDKTSRIFRSMQNNEGVWVHLDKEVDILKGKIEDGSIEGLPLKLTKEKKGTFWNIIGVEEVKNTLQKEALREVQATAQDDRQVSIEGQTAFKLLHEWVMAGTLPKEHQKLEELYWLKLYDIMNKFVYGGSNEQSHKETKADKETETHQKVSTDEAKQEPEQNTRIANIRDYIISLGWVRANKHKFYDYIQKKFSKETIADLSNSKLTILESDLKAMVKQ